MTRDLVVRLAIAALVGLAVGIEREWSGHGSTGPHPRFAGVRTFPLIAGIGGTAGWLLTQGFGPVAVALTAGMALLIAAAYWSASRRRVAGAVDGTTEVAALLVVSLGMLAGIGETGVAGGAGALVVLALAEKESILRRVERLDRSELRATLQFSVLALVVLPVLPDRAFGPLGGINPRSLWIVVLLFSGLTFAGFIARRQVGSSRGYGVAGALGGVVSSTAVALRYARLSRDPGAPAWPLAIGTLAASLVLLPRVIILSSLLNPAVALALLPYLAPPFAVGALMVAVQLRRLKDVASDPTVATTEQSPLGLTSAIKLAFAFQAALMAIEYVRSKFGSPGVLVSAGLLGLTDMDALTLSMNRLGGSIDAVALASRAIAIGVCSNAALKLTVTLLVGASRYRLLAASGLAALLVSGVASIFFIGR